MYNHNNHTSSADNHSVCMQKCRHLRLLAYKKMNLINTRIRSVMGCLVRFEIAPPPPL